MMLMIKSLILYNHYSRMAWNTQPTIGFAAWNGNATLATTKQLLSTSMGLETEIGSITAATWASYPALTNVNVNSHNITNVIDITTSGLASLNNLTATGTTSLNSLTASGTTSLNSLTTSGTTSINNLTTSGNRPNFPIGFNTNGANNFNFQNIDNAQNINGNVINILPQNNLNLTTSNAVRTTVDRGSDVGGSAIIDLTARYGAGSQINLNANSASIYSPTPTSAVNINAQGNVSYLTDIPYGGAVNISAQAGASGAGASGAGGGGINLTSYSYSALVPGTIKESAGSILAYSGLASPLVGVYGYSFYSALNCLSLTAGATTPSGSYPGVVYLRGDNGTKVANGLYADSLTTTGNVSLGGDLSLSAGHAIYMNGGNINLNRGDIAQASNIYFYSGGRIECYSGGSSQGIIQIVAPASGEAGHTNDGIITLKAGTLGTTISIDNTNISLNTSVGSISLNGLTNVSSDLNMNTHNIQQVNNLFSVNQRNTGTLSNLNLSNVGTADFTGLTNFRNSVSFIGATLDMNANTINNVETINSASLMNLNAPNIYGVAPGNINLTTNNIVLTGSNAITLSTAISLITMPPITNLVATGGTITIIGGRKFHTFTASGTFTIVSGTVPTIEIMAIGGGGGGGCQSGGGGGAGNMIIASGVLGIAAYSVVVGGGGGGGVISYSPATNGTNSVFGSSLVALGGGGGGTYGISAGLNGGCGGGGSELTWLTGGNRGFGSVSSPLTSISNLATRGGNGQNLGSQGGAGGGGTAAPGAFTIYQSCAGANGGAGTLYYGTYYGGGGGGSQGGIYWGAPYNGGTGGIGGGGNGSSYGTGSPLVSGSAGIDGTGSGGGGATGITGDTTGFRGGSGIVIISYPYSAGDINVIAPNAINLYAPTTYISTNLTVAGLASVGNLSVAGTTTLNSDLTISGTHNISVYDVNATRVFTTNLTTTTFNGAIATPITNNGNIGFLNNYNIGNLIGDAKFQVKGVVYDGTSIKVGNLPNGIYSFQANCIGNTRRSLSAILLISDLEVSIAQANVLDASDFVQEYAYNFDSGGIFYGYVILNNTTIGSGDSFMVNIKLISGQWDGSASWNIY